jgi:hypothetical protein
MSPISGNGLGSLHQSHWLQRLSDMPSPRADLLALARFYLSKFSHPGVEGYAESADFDSVPAAS